MPWCFASPKATAPSSTPNFHEAWAPFPSNKTNPQWVSQTLSVMLRGFDQSVTILVIFFLVACQRPNVTTNQVQVPLEKKHGSMIFETKLMDVNGCHPFIWNQSLWPHVVRALESYNIGIQYFDAMCKIYLSFFHMLGSVDLVLPSEPCSHRRT